MKLEIAKIAEEARKKRKARRSRLLSQTAAATCAANRLIFLCCVGCHEVHNWQGFRTHLRYCKKKATPGRVAFRK